MSSVSEIRPTIVCADGVPLAALVMEAAAPRGLVQLNPGTGYPKEFYASFARYLAENGFTTCVFDYRGTCGSAPTPMRGCPYRFSDFGTKDIPAVHAWLEAHSPGLPVYVIGHSGGGQQLGFDSQANTYKGLIAVAVSTGYLPGLKRWYGAQALFFFYLFTPVSHLLRGYVAAKPFGIMENLPTGVAREWARWCQRPNYFFDRRFRGKTVPEGLFEHYTFPIAVFNTSDDTICSARNIAAYWQHIRSSAGISHRLFSPHEFGVKQIGHAGFFRKAFRDSIWPQLLGQLEGWEMR